MGLPTKVKTWRFNTNRTKTTASNLVYHQQLILDIKNALIGDGNWDTEPTGIWTVDHSCDGVTAGTPGDGVDRWIDTGDIIAHNPGNNHSWMVLNQVYGFIRILFYIVQFLTT